MVIKIRIRIRSVPLLPTRISKTARRRGEFVPRRAGQISQETQYVLDRFHIDPPDYLPNVGTRVKDMEIRHIPGVSSHISLKKAWNLMRTQNVNTLPIVKDGNILEGLITIGDIAQSYMDVYDNAILSTARTQYKNILETLDGKMVVGNEHAYFVKGKVVIAAANPDLMESYIEENDLVILGNRYESQLCAIEMNASCIIVCEGAPVSRTIQRLAEERVCVVISTPHDTYTVARLINQSMPVKHFMKKEHLQTFNLDDYTESIRDIMAKKRYRDFPVLDKHGAYAGMISRRNLLGTKRRRVILVDHNETSQAVDNIQEAEILEIIDHHRIGSLEDRFPGGVPEPAGGMHRDHYVSDLPGKGPGYTGEHRGASVRSHYLGHADVPVAHLHGHRPERRREPRADRRDRLRGICRRDVRGWEQPQRKIRGGKFSIRILRNLN